jgi:hypothetical protein
MRDEGSVQIYADVGINELFCGGNEANAEKCAKSVGMNLASFRMRSTSKQGGSF